ncbi:MAG: hypothetical protein IPL98_13925 [Saprospiraceae bacterium]|nr:hypothetical protein [Saprospiraceae bacterium]
MRHRLKIIYFIIAILSLTQCKHEQITNKGVVYVLLSWNKLLLELVQTSEGYRPPVSGRMYAYMGIAQWEINRQFFCKVRSRCSQNLMNWRSQHGIQSMEN